MYLLLYNSLLIARFTQLLILNVVFRDWEAQLEAGAVTGEGTEPVVTVPTGGKKGKKKKKGFADL